MDDISHDPVFNHAMSRPQASPAPGASTMPRSCKMCRADGSCYYVNSTRYFVESYGNATGEAAMMSEIQERGPIACAMKSLVKEFVRVLLGRRDSVAGILERRPRRGGARLG